MHFQHHLTDALQWARANEAVLQAHPDVAAVASIIAVDADAFPDASRWSALALMQLPHSVEALTASAALALVERDALRAKGLLQAVLAMRPAEGREWSSLGMAHLLSQQTSEARDAFLRATTFMPGHIGSWHGLGWASLLAGDLAAACDAFEQALALDRNFGESHGAVAIGYALTGNAELARRYIELGVRLDPAALSPRYAQAVLSGAVGRPDEFASLVERALRGQRAPDGRPLAEWVRATDE
jgi:tetratricopeptide (TPR) repeat protein